VLHLRCLLLLALALVAALAPMIDAAVFGIHDHVARAETATAVVVDSSEDHRAPTPHHCELSVSPALGVWYPTAWMPLLPLALLPLGSIFAVRYTPVVPTAPPRA
jgi:hypothetical protein